MRGNVGDIVETLFYVFMSFCKYCYRNFIILLCLRILCFHASLPFPDNRFNLIDKHATFLPNRLKTLELLKSCFIEEHFYFLTTSFLRKQHRRNVVVYISDCEFAKPFIRGHTDKIVVMTGVSIIQTEDHCYTIIRSEVNKLFFSYVPSQQDQENITAKHILNSMGV